MVRYPYQIHIQRPDDHRTTKNVYLQWKSNFHPLSRRTSGSSYLFQAAKFSIPFCWKFDLKLDTQEFIWLFKVRLIGKVFMQIEGVDFSKLFSPVSKYSNLRLILALSAANVCYRVSLDIKTAFLGSPLNQELYLRCTEGFEKDGKEYHVYLLLKALYGPRQAS